MGQALDERRLKKVLVPPELMRAVLFGDAYLQPQGLSTEFEVVDMAYSQPDRAFGVLLASMTFPAIDVYDLAPILPVVVKLRQQSEEKESLYKRKPLI